MNLINNAEQALSILVQAIELAQTKGVFNLQDARLLAESIEFLTKSLSSKISESDKKDDLNVLEESNSMKKKIIQL